MNTHHAVELAVRDSYSKLVSYLAVRWNDLAAAEDALADAFLTALETWPRAGVPDKPEAWLLTTARRRLIDSSRRARVLANAAPTLIVMAEEAQKWASSASAFPDERLKMLFICAHPAIDPSMRTPLMLQTVLGIDAARIASAFVVNPTTMGQRLTRAKTKIRSGDIKFEFPDDKELPQRLNAVLEAIYAAYGSGWDDLTGVDPSRKGLADEAIYLGRVLMQFMSGEPEVQGLLALMLHFDARRDARRNEIGSYVPLSGQDISLWSIAKIGEAERCLSNAAQAGRIGRFQLEAAIQSVHAQRAWTGRTEWEEIALLYEGLVRLAPTIGALVGRAAAVAEARGADWGLALLEPIPTDTIKSYQPYWALTAHLFKRMQRNEEARAAYSRAIGLCTDPSIREFLKQQACQV
jgi:predicted RNA polymerase sigma factor